MQPDKPNQPALRSLSMTPNLWQTLHAALLELALLWHEGHHPAGCQPAGREELEDIMQTLLPLVSAASRWPGIQEREAAVRERLDLPLPAEQVELARELVGR